jgi:hypothetical protein
MASSRELDHLGRLADMAYQEIINDIPSQLARESTNSLSTSTNATLVSDSGPLTPPRRVEGIELFTLDYYQEQGQPSRPFSHPASEEGQLFLPQSYQFPQTVSASDFSTFQDAGTFPTVSHFHAAFHRPVCFSYSLVWFSRLVLLARILQRLLDLRLPLCARLRVAFPGQQHDSWPLFRRSWPFEVRPHSMSRP